MRIALATATLAHAGGSETYAVTVAEHLQRLGHDVWLHALDHGAMAEHAAALGLRVVRELPEPVDVLVVQDAAVAAELAAAHPRTPQVFVGHSDLFDFQLPPQLPGVTALAVALYDRVEQRLRGLAEPVEVVRLTQPIDTERFKPTLPLRPRPAVALALGNYLTGERLRVVRDACERAGVRLRHVGKHGEPPTMAPERVLNDADVVFGKARVVHEAMACGRAAYVLDHNGAEGWVTAESYPLLVADNFGGQSRPRPVDAAALAADLEAYDPAMGLVNRDLAVAHHAATKHAADLAAHLARVVPRAAPVDAPLRELARLVRLNYAADAQG
ncbi:MAG: hypothetical protein HZB46_04485, partial [Solirubrobacterales bacterium]|nr:hypothetical protein [Solirubrobacterales bacterium]